MDARMLLHRRVDAHAAVRTLGRMLIGILATLTFLAIIAFIFASIWASVV